MFQISLQNHRLVVQLPVAVTADLAQQGDGLLPRYTGEQQSLGHRSLQSGPPGGEQNSAPTTALMFLVEHHFEPEATTSIILAPRGERTLKGHLACPPSNASAPLSGCLSHSISSEGELAPEPTVPPGSPLTTSLSLFF